CTRGWVHICTKIYANSLFLLLSSLGREAIAVRHCQMGHPIQRRHFEEQFRGLLREGAGVHPRPKEGLAAKEGGLGQTAPRIARRPFPPPSPQASDRPQVLIPLPRRPRALAVLPNLGVPARRHHRRGPARGECIVAGALVIGPGGTDLADFSLYLRYQ